MRKRYTGIYKINNSANGKFYIGSSKDIVGRWNNHTKNLRMNKHHSSYLQNAWNKYGADCFSWSLIEECELDRDVLIAREQYYMDLLRPHYNMAPIAGSTLGHKASDSARANMSAAAKIRKKRGPCSEETKRKIAATKLGKRRSPETVKKMVENRRPYTPTAETRQKLSDAMKGRVFTAEWKQRISDAKRRK